MKDWFVWKGERCTSHGIHALQLPSITTPEERVEFVDIAGRSGSIATFENDLLPTYSDLSFSVTCVVDNIAGSDNLNDLIRYLRGSSLLEFPDRPGGYYKARIVNQISFDKVLAGHPHRTFVVNFRAEPFWYPYEEPKIVFTGEPLTIVNPGTVHSEPLIVFNDFIWDFKDSELEWLSNMEFGINVDSDFYGYRKGIKVGLRVMDSQGEWAPFVNSDNASHKLPGALKAPIQFDLNTMESSYFDLTDGEYKSANTWMKIDDYMIFAEGKNSIGLWYNSECPYETSNRLSTCQIEIVPRWRYL